MLEGEVITGSHKYTYVYIPRIVLNSVDSKWPFTLQRCQFPDRLCYNMTINKSQGQTLSKVCVYLQNLVFSHGSCMWLCHVLLLRVESRSLFRMKRGVPSDKTKNMVYKEVLSSLQI